MVSTPLEPSPQELSIHAMSWLHVRRTLGGVSHALGKVAPHPPSLWWAVGAVGHANTSQTWRAWAFRKGGCEGLTPLEHARHQSEIGARVCYFKGAPVYLATHVRVGLHHVISHVISKVTTPPSLEFVQSDCPKRFPTPQNLRTISLSQVPMTLVYILTPATSLLKPIGGLVGEKWLSLVRGGQGSKKVNKKRCPNRSLGLIGSVWHGPGDMPFWTPCPFPRPSTHLVANLTH